MNRPLAVRNHKQLLVPQGEFELERSPRDGHLQAWDAADEFILNTIDDLQLLSREARVLIVNDSYGALSVALANQQLYSWNDSFVAQQALRDNLVLNGYHAEQVKTNSGIDFPSVPVDCILLKVPKMLSLLEHQLFALRSLMHHDSQLIAAGMARHIHSSTLEMFETILGPTTTTRARKKSRLIRVERDHSINEGQSPYPDFYALQVDREFRIVNHASLFSRDRLDQGSRLLIEHMPAADRFRKIVDLGCGNGLLGIVAAYLNPQASLQFCDESHMAIASAEENFNAAFGRLRAAEFHVTDCLQGVADRSQDLILLNPPFHQQHGVGDAIAWQMFKDARRVLLGAGELHMVGNRHLGYHAKLKKLFGNCETIASDSKFVVLKAAKESSPRKRLCKNHHLPFGI